VDALALQRVTTAAGGRVRVCVGSELVAGVGRGAQLGVLFRVAGRVAVKEVGQAQLVVVGRRGADGTARAAARLTARQR